METKENIEYRLLDVMNNAELEETALMAAKAMCVDSLWSHAFGPGVVEPLTWLLSKQLILTAGTTTIAVDNTNENVVATITMKPPNIGNLSLWTMIRAGLLLVPIYYGVGAMRRILDANAFFNKPTRAGAWTVNLMAVTPTMQGRGIGTHLLVHGLSKVPPQDVVCLHTQAERNLRFYERQEFKVVEKRQFYGGNEQPLFDSWAMVREPANNTVQVL